MTSPKISFGQTTSRGQFTFGPQDKLNPPIQTFEVQQSTEQDTPKAQDNKNFFSQFDIIYTLRNPGQEVRSMVELLDQSLYLCFKYFVIVTAILSGCGALGNLINLFRLTNFKQLLPILGGTFFASWNAYQLLLLYKGINLKEYKYAQNAVVLMKWFMIATALFLILSFILIEPALWVPGLEGVLGIKYILVVILIIIIAEAAFFLLFLYGAIKVRNLLKEIDDILEGTNYVNQRA